MAQNDYYLPIYNGSHALIIGINKYKNVSPLEYASNDAKAIAEILQSKFKFAAENISLLIDEEATQRDILRIFLRYSQSDSVSPDDRIFIFFAGHGHTVSGRRGEIGYLVPVDGSVSDLSSLIRWDELTRNAELIPAKHILFIMDACYGGLALSRKTPSPGNMRFMKDMLQRYSRQVLTGGKADEPVADSGGTRPGHSIFTSYLLDGLGGEAETDSGIITANSLMSFVYRKVSSDLHSQQTPHFGFFDGDGDFIFNDDILSSAIDGDQKNNDILTSPFLEAPMEQEEKHTFSNRFKDFISDPKYKIRLDDLVSSTLRRTIDNLSVSKFPVQNPSNISEEFPIRLRGYEEAISDIQTASILLARWAEQDQLALLTKIFSRLADADRPRAGLQVWVNLAWYPILHLIYSAGISAISAKRFSALYEVFNSAISAQNYVTGGNTRPILVPVIENLTEIHDAFKTIPGHERKYVPRSEHLFTSVQPALEDLLFLGTSYERYFDYFEVLLALTFADLSGREWGPPGRFAWKHSSGREPSPFDAVVSEANTFQKNWPPLQAGFFSGDLNRFNKIAESYRSKLATLNWW